MSADRLASRLGELVSIETPTGHAAGLADAHALMRSWLEPLLGPAVTETVDGVPHLLWPGEDPRVLLLGHLDTVLPLGTTGDRPFRVDGDIATGPGVFDMKAGSVIMAEALARVGDPRRVSVLLTGDEEIGSPSSRALVEREAQRAGAVLLLEPSLDGALKTTRKGGSIYRLDVEGRGAHAGLEPELGRNALVELAHQVLAVRALADDAQGTTANPTVASAGTVTNAIPDHASMQIDVRAWTRRELERVDAAILALRPQTPDVVLHVSGGINRPPMEDAVTRDLLRLAREVAGRLGHPPLEAVSAGGASDGNFSAALGVRTLDGLGPRGGGAHAVDEWVSMSSIAERVELVAGLVEELLAPQRVAPGA